MSQATTVATNLSEALKNYVDNTRASQTISQQLARLSFKNSYLKPLSNAVKAASSLSFRESENLWKAGIADSLVKIISDKVGDDEILANTIQTVWAVISFQAIQFREIVTDLFAVPAVLASIKEIVSGAASCSFTRDSMTSQTAQHDAAYVLWNMSSVEKMHPKLIAADIESMAWEMLQKDSTKPEVAFCMKLCISCIVGSSEDAERKALLDKIKVVENLVQALDASMNGRPLFGAVWSGALDRIAFALSCVAANDSNKKELFQLGVVDKLFKCLEKQAKNDETIYFILRAILNLSFLNEAGQFIKQQEDSKRAVSKYLTYESRQVKAQADAIMFQITKAGRLNEVQAKQRNCEAAVGKKPRLMISYNWDHQNIVKKIVRGLQRRELDVWFDIDQMGGSTLEAMANAIEGSDIILLCLSDKYQASPNCRTEGEYAFTLRKTIIPLKVQSDHQSRSWLGAIVGSKLYFQFDSDSDESRFDTTFEALLAEIGTQLSRMNPQGSKNVLKFDESSISKPSVRTSPTVDISDVKKWCTDIGLVAVGAKLAAKGVDEAGLRTLKRWEKKDPRLFAEMTDKLTLTASESISLADHLYRLPE